MPHGTQSTCGFTLQTLQCRCRHLVRRPSRLAAQTSLELMRHGVLSKTIEHPDHDLFSSVGLAVHRTVGGCYKSRCYYVGLQLVCVHLVVAVGCLATNAFAIDSSSSSSLSDAAATFHITG